MLLTNRFVLFFYTRQQIEEELLSKENRTWTTGNDDEYNEKKAENEEREGFLLSALVARLISLTVQVRRLRSSMQAHTYDIAEKITLELEENVENILSIDLVDDIDTTLMRPPSLPTSFPSGSTLLCVLEVEACRLELNDMKMCSTMVKALGAGRVGTIESYTNESQEVFCEIGDKFLHGEGQLFKSLSICENLGGCRSPRACTLYSSVEHVLALRRLLSESSWEDFRTALRGDMTTATGSSKTTTRQTSKYAPESEFEIGRCVQESDNHEASVRLVASVTASGPTGIVGGFDTSSLSISSLTKAIEFCLSCEEKDSASRGLIKLRIVSQVLLDVRTALLNDAWSSLRVILDREGRREATVEGTRSGTSSSSNSSSSNSSSTGHVSLSSHLNAGTASVIREITFVENGKF